MLSSLRLWVPALLGVAVAAWPAGVRAADEEAAAEVPSTIDSVSAHALGRVPTAGPASTGPTVLMSGGYGYTGSALRMGDSHHRIAGALALDERPLPWLGLTLRLDGRYDAHVVPGQPRDSGMVGDPRAYVRVDGRWDGGLRLGARAGLWLPGGNAPSVDASALSPELIGMVSYVPPSAPITVSASFGYRLDRSAHSASNAARLTASDRLALQVSAFDAMLVGLATTIGRGRLQGFLEASADVLVGHAAPSFGSSPIFVGGGGRWAVREGLRLEAMMEISPSQWPDTGPSAPLVPVPPRFGAWLGLAYRFGAAATVPPPAPVEAPPALTVAAAGATAPLPAVVTLRGRVSATGAQTSSMCGWR